MKLIIYITIITYMNLALVDLNLLVIFDAIMRERNVTRAGKRLGLTQSAVSNALNRLRHLVKDDLFVRGAEGMIPTTRAMELGPALRNALGMVETAFDPVVFISATATHTFNLCMAPGNHRARRGCARPP